ncbi:MAG: hypothetical protein WC323_01885 [Patescibacteria group bacterium]|jgi:hypothetical protein
MTQIIYLITREIFYVLLVALIVFIAMEMLKPNMVQAYFSLNFVLILWLASGMVLLVSRKL